MVLVDPDTAEAVSVGGCCRTLAMLSDMPAIRLDATSSGHRIYHLACFVGESTASSGWTAAPPVRFTPMGWSAL